MGCSDSTQQDPYKMLTSKYGVDMVKQFTVHVSKVQFIEASKRQLTEIIIKKIETLKGSLLSLIDNEKMEMDREYQRCIGRIQQANSKAIGNAQKTHKTKIQQLMGYSDVNRKFKQYREQCSQTLQREQSSAISYLTNYLREFQEQQRENIPQLSKFQSLPDDQQEKLLKTAKQKNKASVQKGLAQVQDVLQQKCNFQNFQPKFQNIVSKQKLRELSDIANKYFMAGEEKVKGGSECTTC